jgi:hypothetical protein
MTSRWDDPKTELTNGRLVITLLTYYVEAYRSVLRPLQSVWLTT